MFKKIVVFFMVAITLFSMSACKKSEPPVYTSDRVYTIGNWCGVQSTIYEVDENGKEIAGTKRTLTQEEYIEQYRVLADCGITVTQPSLIETGKTNSIKQLRAAQEVGIKQVVLDYALTQNLTAYYEEYVEEDKTFEQIVDLVKDYIADYLEYESLWGFFIKDEPSATRYDEFNFIKRVMDEAAPDHQIYINLFPVYAQPEQLGNITYRKYIQQYLQKVDTDYICYDYYPLIENNDGTTSLYESFLYNMDLINELKDDETELWTFLQCIEYGSNHRGLSSKADATFQAYSFLAYGGMGIQWFTYWYPGATSENFGMPLIDSMGRTTDAYNYVKATNEEIHFLSDYYFNFDHKGIMVNNVKGGEGNFGYVEEMAITSKTLTKMQSSEDLLVGVFEDKDGREGYMVVNFTDPGKNLKNEVTLTINGYKNAIIVKEGKQTLASIKGGKLTFEMQSGHGYFVIPY